MITDEQLTAIRERYEAATGDVDHIEAPASDARFINAVYDDIPELLDEIERLREAQNFRQGVSVEASEVDRLREENQQLVGVLKQCEVASFEVLALCLLCTEEEHDKDCPLRGIQEASEVDELTATIQRQDDKILGFCKEINAMRHIDWGEVGRDAIKNAMKATVPEGVCTKCGGLIGFAQSMDGCSCAGQ